MCSSQGDALRERLWYAFATVGKPCRQRFPASAIVALDGNWRPSRQRILRSIAGRANRYSRVRIELLIPLAQSITAGASF